MILRKKSFELKKEGTRRMGSSTENVFDTRAFHIDEHVTGGAEWPWSCVKCKLTKTSRVKLMKKEFDALIETNHVLWHGIARDRSA